MPVAIRAATRIQDMDDANVSLGQDVDGQPLVYHHTSGKFVSGTGVTLSFVDASGNTINVLNGMIVGVNDVVGIAAWQALATRVHSAGIPASTFARTSAVSGGDLTTGRTYISAFVADRIRQDGYIRQVKVIFFTVGDANQRIKFKVFRPNGALYDMVSESESMVIPGTLEQTINLTTPMACEPGDLLGFWVTGALPGGDGTQWVQPGVQANAGHTIRWADGDVTTPNGFAQVVNNFTMCLEGLTNPPYLVMTGDSIPEGHNTASNWHSFYDTLNPGPAGNPAAEPANQIRELISILQYQNHALGSQTFSWVASTGIVSAVATSAKMVVIHAGVNDVSTGRSWSDIVANLTTIQAALAVGQVLLIDEILPWTAGNDAQALTVRTFNANLAAWCTANDAILVPTHDEMGQVRASTGELDDLKTAYNYDGVHLSSAGVVALATIIARYL